MSLKGKRFFVGPNLDKAVNAKIVLLGAKVFKTVGINVDYVLITSKTAAEIKSQLAEYKESFADTTIYVNSKWLDAIADGKDADSFVVDGGVQPKAKGKKAVVAAKPTAKKGKKVVSESEDEESEESEDDTAPKKTAAQLKKEAAAAVKAAEAAAKVAEKAAAALKKAADAEAKKEAAAAKKTAVAKGKKGKKVESEDEEEESDEEESEDDKKATKKAVATPAAATKRGRAAAKKDAEESESEEEDDAKKPAPKRAVKKDADVKKKDKDADTTVQLPPAAAAPAAPVASTSRMTSKKSVPVDDYVPNKGAWTVLCDETPFFCYDFMLNQTNIGANNNKFYLVQVLIQGAKYGVIYRWGRVGEKGQMQWTEFTNRAAAISHADKKVREKSTHSIYAIINNPKLETRAGKYTYLQRFGALDDGEDDDEEEEEEEEDEDGPKEVLHPRLRSLIEMISDTKMISSALFDFGLDVDKMPLGKLNKQVLVRALEKLAELEREIAQKSPSQFRINQLSSEFYILVPHSHGRATLPPIKDKATVEKKVELVESLMTIEGAKKVLEKKTKAQTDGVLQTYKQIGAEIKYIEPSDPMHKMISEYAQNTIGQSHQAWKGMSFIDIFEVTRPGELERMEEYKKAHPQHAWNKQLLWHGSRLQNFVGILSTGLRLPQQLQGVQITGYMLGSGSYSANVVSKSLNYCSFNSDREGCILLLEILLGGSEAMINPHYTADTAIRKTKNNSVLGLGQWSNDEGGARFLKWSMDGKHELMTADEARKAGYSQIVDDTTAGDSRGDIRPIQTYTAVKEQPDLVKVPMGNLVNTTTPTAAKYLMYDEFVVFNIAQIRIKYICRFKNPNSYGRWW